MHTEIKSAQRKIEKITKKLYAKNFFGKSFNNFLYAKKQKAKAKIKKIILPK